MPSLRDYHTTVKRFEGGDYMVVLQTPLRADADKPDIGWFALVTFAMGASVERQPRIVAIERITTLVRHTAIGLRRKLKRCPVTTEKVTVQPLGLIYTSSTRWGFDSSSTSYPLPQLAEFDGDLLPLVRACITTGEGRPLADWLTENTVAIAPYLMEAGWLPATAEEFSSVQELRGEKACAWGDDDLGVEADDEDDTADYDRWR
jgi:hypothetical protein